ncbi:hypothetical protein D9M71_800550 [compost metagenome]
MQQAVLVEKVASCLFKLALQAVSLAQAAQVEIDQLGLGASVLWQLALKVFAGFDQAQARPHQLPLRLAFAFAQPH